VSLLVAGGDRASADPQHPELMMRNEWWNGVPEVLTRTTVVCGCGGSDAVRDILPRLLSLTPRIVLDADALNAIAADSTLRTLLRARRAKSVTKPGTGSLTLPRIYCRIELTICRIASWPSPTPAPRCR
jgi:NAD(P)H-hydrate repair Nnr-like enzyme with NAD(P)H-hydrate dehydratase domain